MMTAFQSPPVKPARRELGMFYNSQFNLMTAFQSPPVKPARRELGMF